LVPEENQDRTTAVRIHVRIAVLLNNAADGPAVDA